MSRSRRQPYAPFCGGSQKREKRLANRALRRIVRLAVRAGDDVLATMREVANVYDWSQDGTRRYVGFTHENAMRRSFPCAEPLDYVEWFKRIVCK